MRRFRSYTKEVPQDFMAGDTCDCSVVVTDENDEIKRSRVVVGTYDACLAFIEDYMGKRRKVGEPKLLGRNQCFGIMYNASGRLASWVPKRLQLRLA